MYSHNISFDYNNFYSKASFVYNHSRLDTGAVFSTTLKYITDHIQHGAKTVLDIGCGTGEYGFALKQLGYTVQGVDKSLSQLEIAQTRIPALRSNILDLELPNDSFDVVLLIMMIHQIDNSSLNRAFAEVSRVLKPNGRLIIKTCFEDDIRKRLTSKYFPSCFSIDMLRYPTREYLVSLTDELILRSCDTIALSEEISKNKLVHKLRLRGASNVGMLSDEELESGINLLLQDYRANDTIQINYQNTFLVFECCK